MDETNNDYKEENMTQKLTAQFVTYVFLAIIVTGCAFSKETYLPDGSWATAFVVMEQQLDE